VAYLYGDSYDKGINLVFSYRLGTICDYFGTLGGKNKKTEDQDTKKVINPICFYRFLNDI
jgi:hypothetical protein